MAIEPLTAPYKTLTFDGETSASFGVQILGKGTFNAPKRDVKMISVPGRSGELALDNGRFENIKVKYPARLIANSTDDFADAISEFRNFLCSRKGYCRLTDDYNPDEYRMAVYKEGLDVDVDVLKAGKFDIVFDCKPQRYLTSGEETVEMDSGDTITNPTLFEAGPLLLVEGLGNIEFNGYTIERNDAYIGDVQVLGSKSGGIANYQNQVTFNFDLSQLNTGDDIFFNKFNVQIGYSTSKQQLHISDASITSTTNATASVTTAHYSSLFNIACNNITFKKGTSKSVTCTVGISMTYHSATYTGTEQITIAYDGTNTLTITIDIAQLTYASLYKSNYSFPPVIGNSTISTVTHPTFIDCDIGEAYYVVNDEIISANAGIVFSSDLPTLAPGMNTITYDNTITSFSITPRWWKI